MSETNNRESRKRRSSAEDMAKSQKEISVSEFFAKNRHLLGFDNPRKALLTTVKEAVDNSLDACEEAGILPEIWVHIEAVGTASAAARKSDGGRDKFKVAIQDNGPGIVKKQIPLIFGKLLYGSKFHRLRMSRGQQGIGISAAGMYGLLTTGKPIKVASKISPRKPTHYFEIKIDTKTNMPVILNGNGDGEDLPRSVGRKGDTVPNDEGRKKIAEHGIEWIEVERGTRVTIELEAKYNRGRGSVDEFLEQTAISNPHVTIHYADPDGNEKTYTRVIAELPPEPVEIKPHPYGVELGRLDHMIYESKESSLGKFLAESFSKVSPNIAKQLCTDAGIDYRKPPHKVQRHEVEKLYEAIQSAKIPSPQADCISPIGEEHLLKGLHQVVPGQFFVTATRPPAVYRGNPFQIEVGLAFGGSPASHKVSLEALQELLSESDARTLRQFLTSTFDGLGADAADKIIKASRLRPRVSPKNIEQKEIVRLHESLQSVNLSEGQTMNVFRYANRVPLQFQPGACLITQTVMGMNWRAYGLNQSRGQLPRGAVTLIVHLASVWVPFTSESKEAIASYPEIQKELRLALQSVGRKLGMYMKRREKVKHEGERRSIFMRYLGEVAMAVSGVNGMSKQELFDALVASAKRKTATADVLLGEDGLPMTAIDFEGEKFGENVIVVA